MPRELTFKAIALGLFLSFVFGASNAWLGMRAGQTVAATIPAAVIAMALFRTSWLRGTIEEQNIVRTAASVGEALVAGAIFTIPAFMLIESDGGRLWQDLKSHYWEATLILLLGGLLGVFFIILLRRPLCVDAGLPWPEAVASAEIVRAGADKSDAPRYIFGAMAFGALIQFFKSDKGVLVFTEYLEGFLSFPQAMVGNLQVTGGIPWSTPALSPALIGIGYIIGFRLASINVAGGVLAWWVLIPLLGFINPAIDMTGETPGSPNLWREVVRPVAVGAMLVAAANTLLGMRGSIAQSLRGALSATGAAGGPAPAERTERDLPTRWVLIAIAALLVPTAVLYYWFTGGWTAALLAAAVMSVIGFLLSAVGGFLVGLVGSSNQPVSGLTLAALVISALFLLAGGVRGTAGMAAVLGVASVVCCAICVSGSLIQDLKAGHLLGGTPWKMQVVEIVSVVLLAFFLMAPIIALHEANLDSGGIGGRALPAPQAGLMAQLTRGIVSGQMAWGLLGIGAAMAGALLLTGARAPMLIAVGMYLPFDTTSAIFLGGLIHWLAMSAAGPNRAAEVEERGTLLASGLIAGEAIMGIVLAVTFVAGIPSFSQWIFGKPEPAIAVHGAWMSIIAFAAIACTLIYIPMRRGSGGVR